VITEREAREEDYHRKHGYVCHECGEEPVSGPHELCSACYWETGEVDKDEQSGDEVDDG
jgi:hypothetical protein